MPEMCSMTNQCAIKVINYLVMSSNNEEYIYYIKWRTRKFEMFLVIICEVASHFSFVRKF